MCRSETALPLVRPPRTIFVKVSTELLSDLSEWSEPLRVKVERDWNDDTYEMVFRLNEGR